MTQEEKLKQKAELDPNWQLTHNQTRLERKFKFKNFKKPLELVQVIAQIAEEQKHHPEISFGWGHLTIEIWTHTISNLTQGDFQLALKIDEAYEQTNA